VCLVVGGTGVTFLGDGSAPQRGVGVKQSGGWLRWIRMVFVFVDGGTRVLLELLLKLSSELLFMVLSELLSKLLLALYPILMMTPRPLCIYLSFFSICHTYLPLRHQSSLTRISAATIRLEAKAYRCRH
jgi:hypothetical protein